MKNRIKSWLLVTVMMLSIPVFGLAQDSVSVSFSVNLAVQQELGVYEPSIHTPAIAGSFNGWETSDLNFLTDTTFTATFLFDTLAVGDTLEYKFQLVDTAGTITWERDFDPVNRIYTYMGGATDNDADGYKDVDLQHMFNDWGYDYLQLPLTPYANGDVANLNGSFASSDTTSNLIETLSWLTYVLDGSSTFSIVTDAQDGDNRAVEANIVYNGTGNDWNTQLIQEPIFVDNGQVLQQSIWMKADAPGRVASVWVALGNNDGYLNRNYNTVELSTEWTEYTFEYVTNRQDARQYVRAGVSLNHDVNDGATISIDNQTVTILDAPAVPTPPYAFGDVINLNGSFSLSPLGPLNGETLAWSPFLQNNTSTFEVVLDSQDDDGSSLMTNVQYNGSTDFWNAQIIHEPINVQADETYQVSFWLKADAPGRKAEFFIGLGENGGFANRIFFTVDVSDQWSEYIFQYTASQEDQDLSLRAGVNFNFTENDGGVIWTDNLSVTKIQRTTVNFSVNTSVANQNGYFDYPAQKAQLVGSLNGWDLNNPIEMFPSPGDSVFSVDWNFFDVNVGDTVFYKYVLRDTLSGNFEWDSPDPSSPTTAREFSDRFFVFESQDNIVLPTDYYSDFEPSDKDPDSYGITTITDSRMEDVGVHLAVEGIVTYTTTNWVHLQDESGAGTMIFSRPFFSDMNSVAFNLAVASGDINVGDRIKVSGVVADFNGLHEIIRIHGWEVVSTANALPDAQEVTLTEVAENGENYESEIVFVSRFELVNPVDTLFAGIYDIVSEDGSEFGHLYIPAAANSEWAGQPALEGLMSFNGILKEVFNELTGENQYVLTAQYVDDIIDEFPRFEGAISINDLNTLPDRSWNYPVALDDLGVDSVNAFEFTFLFDPAGMNLTLSEDQTNTLAENFTVVTNSPTPGELRISGASVDAITGTGALFELTLDVLGAGEYFINVVDPLINESPADPFSAFINVVPRLCGDVTGDETVGALDATAVLRHTVLLSPEYPLSGIDSTAADVTGNGDISAFDASVILQKEVGLISGLNCLSLPLKDTPDVTSANWFVQSSDDGSVEVDLDLSGSDFGIMSVELELDTRNGISFAGFENLPDSWNTIQNMVDDKMRISVYGVTPLEEKTLTLRFNNPDTQNGMPAIAGSVVLNENAAFEMSELKLGDVPTEFVLNQNYPNPFNPSTNISYAIPTGSDVELSVFNMLGQKVATLVSETQEAGTYSVTWDASNMSSGMYLYQLRTGSFVTVKRMLLVK